MDHFTEQLRGIGFTDTRAYHNSASIFRSIPHTCRQKLKLNGVAKHIHAVFHKGLLKDVDKGCLFITLDHSGQIIGGVMDL